jgi:hypothetical protein
MTLLGGGSTNEAFKQAGIQGLFGGVTGALIGGTIQGIVDWRNGKNFWTGKRTPVELGPIQENVPTINDHGIDHPKYDFTLDTDGANTTLYRGTTGSENDNGLLFLTDDPSYASLYVKNNGEVVEVTLPNYTIKQMQFNGDMSFPIKGSFGSNNGAYYNEYYIKPGIKPFIVKMFKPYKP